MTFLPIVARELRVASRRRSTYRVRSFAALVVILGGAWIFLFMGRATPQQMALYLFATLSGCCIFFGVVSGCFATADCVSEEKREGTLGLLFLTDLKGYDVVLGKLVANSVNSFYTMVAVVPLLAVPLMLGGLTPGDFLRMALVAVSALFLSLATGVFVSSLCRVSAKSVGLTFLLMFVLTAGLPAAGAYLSYHTNRSGVAAPFLLPSAFYAYSVAPDQEYKLWPGRYWGSLIVMQGLGWIFLGLASRITPRVWQDRPAGVRQTPWRDSWRQWCRGNPDDRDAFRRRLLRHNAFYWLASRTRRKPLIVWVGLALIAAGWFWGLAEYKRDWVTEPWSYLLTGLCVHLFLRVRFAGEAPWQLAEERKAGTLELLLSTPLTVPEIIRGQRLALQHQFLMPVLLALGLDFAMLFVPDWLLWRTRWNEGQFAAWIAVWLGAMVLLVADFYALFWVGLWQGLTARTALRASGNSLGNVFMIPCVFYALFLLWLVVGITGRPGRPTWNPGPWSFFWAWLVPRLITDCVVGLYAREKLVSHFRLAAQQSRDPRPRFWGWWLGSRIRGS